MNQLDYKHFAVPIVTAAAEPTTWRPAIDAHCLLVGGPTGGRAELTDTVTADFAAAGWSVQRGYSTEKQQEIITDTWVLMEQRYAHLMENPDAREQIDPVLLVVDEEYGAVARIGQAPVAAATDQVHHLLRLARSARIHVLVCTSSPTFDLLPADVRDNLAVRVPVDEITRDDQLMQV